MGEAVLTCTHNVCFEQKIKKKKKKKNYQLKISILKLKKSLFIAWASFRNEMCSILHGVNTFLQCINANFCANEM